MRRDELVAFLDEELDLGAFGQDVSNNGLQVEGKAEVIKAAFGVDACQAFFDRAKAWGADFLFVHHGLSWGSEPRRFTGVDAARFGALFRNRVSLYAAHLPLDAHPVLGNNAVLCGMLGLKKRRSFCNYNGYDIGFCGELPRVQTAGTIAGKFRKLFPAADVRLLGAGAVRSVAVVSGGGGMDALLEAAQKKCDLLVTGELTHVMYHPALESGVKILALGHYASETPGPLAVMEKIRGKFGIETRFFDLPTML